MMTRLMRDKRTWQTIRKMVIILCILGKILLFEHAFSELMDNKYIILKKMGWGHFSTVWLAFNIKDKQLYALKIMRSHSRYAKHGYDEETINRVIAENRDHPLWLKIVKGQLKADESPKDHTHCLQMHDWFFHHALHGKHFVMVFEVLGKNLLNLLKKYQYRGIPIPLVREITKQLLLGLDYMHRVCRLIHTDLKPENVTFAMSQEEEFDLLYKHVFQTPLIKIYDNESGGNNVEEKKEKTKNQKKKERKKRKKMEDKGKVVEGGEESEEEKVIPL